MDFFFPQCFFLVKIHGCSEASARKQVPLASHLKSLLGSVQLEESSVSPRAVMQLLGWGADSLTSSAVGKMLCLNSRGPGRGCNVGCPAGICTRRCQSFQPAASVNGCLKPGYSVLGKWRFRKTHPFFFDPEILCWNERPGKTGNSPIGMVSWA